VFANRFTAFVDACVLASALRRNLLCSLAEAEFFRIRWSPEVLDETEEAIRRMVAAKDDPRPAERAQKARCQMETAFPDALVNDHNGLMGAWAESLPDPNDAHVVAAALKTQAAVIVTDNLRHFPDPMLLPLNLFARSADDFIADTIDLDAGRAIAAVRQMRERFAKPALDATALLERMEASGLIATADVPRPYLASL
jgi:predicted nucleic acid-binding protein